LIAKTNRKTGTTTVTRTAGTTTVTIVGDSAGCPDGAASPTPDPSAVAASEAATTFPRRTLRLWPISDLHLAGGEGWSAGQIPQADVAGVAGDACEGIVAAVEWLARHIRPHMPVVFTPGNHEFYGTIYDRSLLRGREAASVADIHLLDGDQVVIDDVRFIGATLWTDYRLFGKTLRSSAMETARTGLNDHRHIGWAKNPWKRFRPEEAAVLHNRARLAIESHLVLHYPGPTVVVTHHAPHPQSISREFRTDLLSAAYASDLSDLITRAGPDLWIHGHTHHAVDYCIGMTRILSNPRGYRHEGASTGFDPMLVVEV
jgi:Icc-related predicted phosphoesterase